MRRIAIITEGGVTMGLGHVQRMLTLAATLRETAQIFFITASGAEVRQKIETAGHDVVAAAQDYKAALAAHFPLDVVVIDRLHVDESLARWVRDNSAARLAIFGNVSPANADAHLVVNAIVGTRFENRRYRDPGTESLYLEGPRYVMLGETFRTRRNSYVHTGRLERMLLMFGGSDQANLTCRAAKQLRDAGSFASLTACVGAVYPHDVALDALTAEEERAGHRFRIVRNSNAVADLMRDADFVLTSPGNSLFEAFSLGVPAAAFFQTPAQAGMFRGFPCCHAPERIGEAMSLVEQTYGEYDRYRSLIDPLEVGHGYDEIVHEIERAL